MCLRLMDGYRVFFARMWPADAQCSMLNVPRDGFGAYKHTILPSYKEAEYFSRQGTVRHNQQI